ncbi:iron ABC transporter permease [uncultured Selenomonas sp.]|uniref:FecCD family ABC transporter permease n=1 Tax=uncultured Selenomonas sp. TaxID=159275 RepID=UPI0028DBBCB8|nr:iron ABC transporter permease [uncultured Selenomonas sp.]
MNKEWKGRTLFFFLLVVLVAELFLCLGIGSVHLGYDAIYAVVKEGLFGPVPVTAPKQGPVHDIVWMLRMPRLLLAACTGAGLAACGVVMQAIVRNPLADPYILGVSSGASLGAAAAILLGIGTWLGTNFVGIAAFLGAFGVSLLVLVVANIRGTADPVRLLLAGMALSTACSAISSFIIYFANDKSGVQSVIFWLMGSFAGARWEMMAAIALVTLLGAMFFWTQSSILDLMLLGDAEAVTLGRNLKRYREVYLVFSSLVIGFLVYAAGMIGFVGLIVPHAVRFFTGAGHRSLLPWASITGASLMVGADALARSLIPRTEIPVGLIIALIGAPAFVYLIVKRNYSFGSRE